jgi:hypothetical protein
LFVAALPLTILLALRFARGALSAIAASLRRRRGWDAAAIPAAYVAAGVALYLYWLLGDALLPGGNTPIKFIYNAHIVPAIVLVGFSRRITRGFGIWLAYATVLFLVALPVAVFWPSG